MQGMAVAGGAAIGALMRWGTGLWLNPLWGGFPLGTLAVNVVGGLLIGMALVLLRPLPGDLGWLFAVTGVLGGFTTFSAFSAESLGLLQRGHWALAAGHAVAHMVGALLAAGAGLALARRLFDA
jgi:fluoride exporter